MINISGRRPRAPIGAPERNIIQRPELVRRLASRLGVRQAHVSPTLNEGVQPVVIVDDISKPAEAEEFLPRACTVVASMAPNVAQNPWAGIYSLTQPDIAGIGAPYIRTRPRTLRLHRITYSNVALAGSTTRSLVGISVERGRFPGRPGATLLTAFSWDQRADFGWVPPFGGTGQVANIEAYMLLATGFIPGGQIMMLGAVQPDATKVFDFTQQNIYVPPGYTIWAFADQVNVDLDLTFEFVMLTAGDPYPPS